LNIQKYIKKKNLFNIIDHAKEVGKKYGLIIFESIYMHISCYLERKNKLNTADEVVTRKLQELERIKISD